MKYAEALKYSKSYNFSFKNAFNYMRTVLQDGLCVLIKAKIICFFLQ